MATKAERARAQAERSGRKTPRQPKRQRGRRRAAAADRIVGELRPDAVVPHNLNDRAAKRGGDALEISAGRPSRKSTRRSSGRIKRTTNQQRQAIRETTSPHARADRAKVAKR